MALRKNLLKRRGGLILIKTQLWWYGQGYDHNPDRICLLLDVDCNSEIPAGSDVAEAFASNVGNTRRIDEEAIVLLLLDGKPRLVWVGSGDVELIDGKF